MELLPRLALQWLQGDPRRLERAAALRDVEALVAAAPVNLGSLRSAQLPAAESLLDFTAALATVLRQCILCHMRSGAARTPLVISPFAGGVSSSSLPAPSVPGECTRQLKLASLNPGRTGLAALGTNAFLHWRLQAIVATLQLESVDICALPGARFPPGTQLPDNFPYAWLGVRSLSWGAVGVLVRCELEAAVEPLLDLGGDRVLWLRIRAPSQVVHVCAFYPSPGGDLCTWGQIVHEYRALALDFPSGWFVLLGDGNVHLTHQVLHDHGCCCPHCKQSPQDAQIQAMIDAAGLQAATPPGATHDSGTAIDIVLVSSGTPQYSGILPGVIGLSDHKMIHCTVPLSVGTSRSLQLGRVAWTDQGWEAALASVQPLLVQLTASIWELLAIPSVRPQMLGGKLPLRQRRSLLDAAAWSRNVLFVLAGHFAGNLRCALARQSGQEPPPRIVNPDGYASHKEFRAAVGRQVWLAQQRAVHKYIELRQEKSPQAERFLSKCLVNRSDFYIALSHEGSVRPLSVQETLAALVGDLQARADNNFPQDPEWRDAMQVSVGVIRQSGASPQGLGNPLLSADFSTLYTQEEVDLAIDAFKTGKRCLGLPYAALKATNGDARALTCALVNLGRHMCLSSTHWSLRQFGPIRKSGPKIVRTLQHLRPISLSCDMAQIQDALWVRRNGPRLEKFCGPGQSGGAHDPISLILGLIMHVQLRAAQGLPCYLGFADLKWAFDLADLNGMRLNCYMAGIVAADWLLIDDILTLDQQCVLLHGWLSAVFTLGCGTAQGRRFSVHVFNGLLRWLPDEVEMLIGGGSRTTMPPFTREVLHRAALRSPPESTEAPPRAPRHWQETVATIASCASGERAPWPQTQELLIGLLATFPRLSDRIACLEQLGAHELGPQQYVDDLSVACPSVGALAAVLARTDHSACGRYARKARAAFNYGPGKTAAMAMHDSPDILQTELGCDVVSEHVALGVRIDSALSFQPFLQDVLRRGRATFLELFHAAETGGFPVPVIAAQTLVRIEPALLYGAALLVVASGSLVALNRLQQFWARTILGCTQFPRLPWPLVRASCGWDHRLSSRVLEYAFLARARLFLLPPEHAGPQMLRLAMSLCAPCWASEVKALMASASAAGAIKDVEDCGAFSEETLALARRDRDVRRAVLKQYRWSHVRPALLEQDLRVFDTAAAAHIPVLGVPFALLSPFPGPLPLFLFGDCFVPQSWRWFRCWALVRMSGRWPAVLVGSDDMPFVLDCCPLCGAEFVYVVHPLFECPAFATQFQDLRKRFQLPARTDRPALVITLFAATTDLVFAAACIEFVGSAILACMTTVEQQVDPEAAPLEVGPASEARVDAMARLIQAACDYSSGVLHVPDCSYGTHLG